MNTTSLKAPQTITDRLKFIGPSAIVTGSVVGSGSIVMTPLLGAAAGFTLLWWLLLSIWTKPIIQAECYTLRLKHRIFPHRFLKRLDLKRLEDIDFTYKIQSARDLFSRVYYALNNVEEMKSHRKKASEFYLYKNDGKASSRLLDALENYN